MTENYAALDVGVLEWRPEEEIILGNDQESQNSQEETPVSPQAVKEYLIFKWHQYQASNRKERSKILDEIEGNTPMHRGSIIRLMNKRSEPEFRRGKGRSVNRYTHKSRALIVELWRDMGYLGSVRFKAAIPLWIDKWEHKELDAYTLQELKTMSSSTIERILKPEKAKLRRRLNTGTKPSKSKIKTEVPIRDLEEDVSEPGHCEVDCVAHCGGSLSGEHIWTLTLTDILTGHTENEALQFKNGFEVMLALHRIEDRLPFKIKALYVDNGSEFLNQDVHKRFIKKKNKIERKDIINFFRSRPYKKNDQCYVEQKNYTHVRELFGYERLSGDLIVRLMNHIYRNEWRLLNNYFHPQRRLKEKTRTGSKIKKTFHDPRTPFEQLRPYLTKSDKEKLEEEIDSLNPFMLRKKLKKRLREFQAYNSRPKDQLGKYAI